jgi:hypothetical protein
MKYPDIEAWKKFGKTLKVPRDFKHRITALHKSLPMLAAFARMKLNKREFARFQTLLAKAVE